MNKYVPKSEKISSFVLLLALVGGVLAVLMTGMVQPKPSAATPAQKKQIAYTLPPKWSLVGDWEIYPEDKIYEKIDGQAALYQQYGVDRLDFASAASKKFSFDIYIYTMKTPDAALGVYLALQPQEFSEINLGDMADASIGMVRAFRGRYYLEVQAADKKSDSSLAQSLAADVLKNLKPEKSSAAAIYTILPKTGRVQGSLTLNKDNAFGLKSLGQTFSASYELAGVEFDYLVRKISQPKAAVSILDQAKKEILEFGGKMIDIRPDRISADFMGKKLILLCSDNFIIGLYGNLPMDRAQENLALLEKNLRSESNGPK